MEKHKIHEIVKTLKIKPILCEHCNVKPARDLANIKEHNYTLDPNDYIYLCSSCHKKMDMIEKNKKRDETKIEETKKYGPYYNLKKSDRFAIPPR